MYFNLFSLAEQLTVEVTKTTNDSADIVLSCGRSETFEVNYTIILTEQEFSTVNRTIMLICGISQTIPDLKANTSYSLNRTYSDQMSCNVVNFMTNSTSKLVMAIMLPRMICQKWHKLIASHSLSVRINHHYSTQACTARICLYPNFFSLNFLILLKYNYF